MQFSDAVSLRGVQTRDDGFLVADAFAARTGVQLYAGSEVGRPDLPIVGVYRDASEVFSHASLATFSHIPITLDHPSVMVASENWKDLAVGETSTDVLREGDRLKIPLIIKAADAIAAIKDGKRQLSVGYTCELEWADGQHDGVPYQAKQLNIRANHLAIVDQARAGPDFKIGDWVSAIEDAAMTTPQFQAVTIDGITIQTTPQGAEAITKLQASITTLTADIASLKATVGERDKELGTIKIDMQKLKDTPPPDLDKLVADRAKLVEQARTIAKDLKPDGMTDSAIRRAAVIAAFGEAIVKDISDAQVEGMFLAATAKGVTSPDPVAEAMRSRPPQTDGVPEDHGQSKYEQRLRDAWKGTKAA